VTYFITLIVAYCSIVYELLIAQTLSALMGNTIMRYSITIGLYLASMGVGASLCQKRNERDSARQLIHIEIWLSVIGGLAVFVIFSFDVFHRFLLSSESFFSYGVGNTLRPGLFFILSHLVIILIGILSGFEIPLLVALSEARKPNTMNIVLGVDYFGSLLGAILFPLLLLPKLGLFAVSYLTGLLNAVACILVLLFKPAAGKFRYAKITAAVTVGLLFLLAFTENTQNFFLKKFYYYPDVVSFSSLLSSFENHPNIQEYRSPYQHIHIVSRTGNDVQNMIYTHYSNKFAEEINFPKDTYLFLNNKFQLATNTEEFYHEFFVHVPIQWAQPPKEVLVLGAGDGIVLRELLKYEDVKRITLVDIDPKVLHISRYHPFFQRVNHHSFADPRVTLIIQDAFTWLQTCSQKFDAVYIDFPDAHTYDLAKLYSLEFYALVRRCVSEEGFVVADLPGGERNLWDAYYSTLKAANFKLIKPFDSLIEDENEGVRELEKQLIEQAEAEIPNEYGYPMTIKDPEFLSQEFRELVRETIEAARQRFIVLQLKDRPVRTRFRDYGIRLHVLNETRFKLASKVEFDDTFKPGRINSVFRPTIPALEFFNVNLPY
jgi:spermidine synthase